MGTASAGWLRREEHRAGWRARGSRGWL